jgi:hypothetical protein
MPKHREVILAPKALEMMEAAHPSAEEREAIRNVLTDLGASLAHSFQIAFMNPPTYRIDAGRFRIHFRYNQREVQVGFIGVY